MHALIAMFERQLAGIRNKLSGQFSYIELCTFLYSDICYMRDDCIESISCVPQNESERRRRFDRRVAPQCMRYRFKSTDSGTLSMRLRRLLHPRGGRGRMSQSFNLSADVGMVCMLQPDSHFPHTKESRHG